MYPLEKTIAFGGVPAGSMKPKDAESVAANIKGAGWRPKLSALAARIGRMMPAVAVLEATSVTMVVTAQIINVARKGCNGPAPFNRSAMQPVKPELCMA